jgi:hypothetical protein
MHQGAVIARLIQRRVAAWRTEESDFASRQRQEIFLYSTASHPVS